MQEAGAGVSKAAAERAAEVSAGTDCAGCRYVGVTGAVHVLGVAVTDCFLQVMSSCTGATSLLHAKLLLWCLVPSRKGVQRQG